MGGEGREGRFVLSGIKGLDEACGYNATKSEVFACQYIELKGF